VHRRLRLREQTCRAFSAGKRLHPNVANGPRYILTRLKTFTVCLAIEREKEGSILTLGVQGEIITKYRDSCAFLYLVFIFIFLHSRRPLQTAICGME